MRSKASPSATDIYKNRQIEILKLKTIITQIRKLCHIKENKRNSELKQISF